MIKGDHLALQANPEVLGQILCFNSVHLVSM
jgi:hypothetical protein